MIKKRYESLDVLRGMTVTFMCMVNNPGTWSHMYAPMEHAPWTGCTPTDLIYPFFIFCMGVAMAFSFTKYEGNTKAGVLKVIKRSCAIFLVGFLLNCYPFFPTDHGKLVFGWDNWVEWFHGKRIFGVLQRIAMAYLIGGLLAVWLKKPKKILVAMGILCVLYTAILVIFGNEPGPFTLEGTISRKVDVALLGDSHVYHGYSFADGTRAAFDPEGPLGALTAAVSCLIGYLVGCFIKKTNNEGLSQTEMVCKIFVAGILSLGFAELVSIWIPISKPLWSVSYVFYAGGWAMIGLAALSYIIDICSVKKVFTPFKIMGSNALMAFILSAVIAKSYQFVGWVSSSTWFGLNNFTSFCYSCLFALVIFLCLWALYRKKIYIRL